MKFTQVAADAFQSLQLNAGVILVDFDPTDPGDEADIKENIAFATADGSTFNSTPTYVDFGEGIDNVPANTKQLKRIDHYEPHLTGTAKTFKPGNAERLLAGYTKTTASGVTTYTPRTDLDVTDFADMWWVGDYSDKNGATNGGYIAIKLENAINVGGLQIKSNDKGKGDFAFDFQAHYDLTDITHHPFELYVAAGTAEEDATLSALTIGSVTLSPTFSSSVTTYTGTTTSSSSTVTATATDNTASVSIKNGTTTVTNGGSASWSAGANTLKVTVTKGSTTKEYTVTVTKS